MGGSVALLFLPSDSAIRGGHNRAEGPDRPALQWIIRSKSDAEEMIPDTCWSIGPISSRINCRQDDAACPDNDGPRLIFYVKPVQSRAGTRPLFFPDEAAIRRP